MGVSNLGGFHSIGGMANLWVSETVGFEPAYSN